METPTPVPEDSHRPELDKDGFDCPQCGRWSHQVWDGLQFMIAGSTRRVVLPGEDPYQNDCLCWQISVCQRCEQPSLWRHDQLVYPRTRLVTQPHPDMPRAVRVLYEEAAAVGPVSRRAGAALARATVERLIKHLDPDAPKGANLDKRIERVKARGVSTPVGEMLDVVRVTGNHALHVDDQPGELVVLALDDQDGPQLLELFLELVNDLVDELITKPATTRALWDKLPEGVKFQLRSDSDASGGSATRRE